MAAKLRGTSDSHTPVSPPLNRRRAYADPSVGPVSPFPTAIVTPPLNVLLLSACFAGPALPLPCRRTAAPPCSHPRGLKGVSLTRFSKAAQISSLLSSASLHGAQPCPELMAVQLQSSIVIILAWCPENASCISPVHHVSPRSPTTITEETRSLPCCSPTPSPHFRRPCNSGTPFKHTPHTRSIPQPR